MVTAEDDGQILRCDVIVDRIQQLRIVTKTLELFLEEAPEQFFVRAYDEQGIEFVFNFNFKSKKYGFTQFVCF